MEDLDKDFNENENQENKDFFDTEKVKNNDIKTCEDGQTGMQKSEKELEVKEENTEKEEKADFGEDETDSEEEKDDKEKDATDHSVNSQYHPYTPPYYVPNFTIQNDSTTNNYDNFNPNTSAPPKNRRRMWKTAFIVSLVTFAVVLICSLVILFLLDSKIDSINQANTNAVDLGDEQLNIIQNSPKLEINKNTDPNYVPKSLPEVVNKVADSVVEIKTSSMAYDMFYGQYVTSGAGSGVIITQSDDAGYLLTNHHVIFSDNGNVAEEITVVLTNGKEYRAIEIGNDESLDLAVLRIEKKATETFTVAEFGDSNNLVVGQDILAIGNPLGSLGGTVTDGIISALDRQVKVGSFTMTLLQHNAAINPGNSGGALFDMMGNLVGIVNAKTSDTGIEGLGFAIPSNVAENFFYRVMVIEPAIGIRVKYGQAKNYPLGIYVVSSVNESFQYMDRVVKVNGETVDTLVEYYEMINSLKDEKNVTVTVQRKQGSTMQIKEIDIKVDLN